MQTSLADSVVAASCPLIKPSWFTIPMGYYQQETSVALGIVGGYYFPSNNMRKISSVSGSVIYTFRNQFMVNANPRFYANEGKCFINGNINLRYYPSFYFGIGNATTTYEIPYVSRSFHFSMQPGYFVNDNWQVGPYILLRGENVIKSSTFYDNQSVIYDQFGSVGWSPYWLSGVGLFSTYDTRDNVFYPSKHSIFAKSSVINYAKILGSSYDFSSITFDLRHYIPIWLNHIIAWQMYFDARVGDNIPFQMLPSVGGSDNLRGFRERQYIDKIFSQLQVEYRVPIWNRLKATGFFSIGDVVDLEKQYHNAIKISYGGGLRFRLNDARVHLRFDVAKTNYGNIEFYITATEAF